MSALRLAARRASGARRARRAVPLAAASVALLSAAAACGGGGDGPAAPPPAPPSAPAPARTLALTAAPAVVTVRQGESAGAGVSVTRGGHDAMVALSATTAGAPAGLVTSFAPADVPAGASASAVTLATTAATPPGDYTVTISGAGGGASATATLVVRVTAAPAPAPSAALTLTAPAAPVAVTAGGAAAPMAVGVARQHFAGGVVVTASGAPAGLVVVLPSAPVTGDAAALTVQAAASLAAGDYPVTVQGAAEAVTPATTIVVVRVAAAPAPPPPAPPPPAPPPPAPPPPAPAPVPPPTPAPEAGVVTGIARNTRGRPLDGVLVQAKMMFNSNVVRAHTGVDGRYTVRGLPATLAAQVWAHHEFQYRGRTYCARLAMPSVADYDPFVPSTTVTRDFRWQLTGRVPDAGNNRFGASLSLALGAEHFYTPVLETGDDVEVTLTPLAPLADGSEGAVVTRTVRYSTAGWDSRLDDIPHGVYAAQVTRVRDGVRTRLRVGNLTTGAPLGATTTVEWEPANSGGTCGSVLNADLRTFSLRLALPE